MQISQWDQSFARLQSDISKMELPARGPSLTDQIVLTQKQSAILQFESAIEASLEHIDLLKTRDHNIDAKSKSIVYWAHSVAKTIKRTYQKKATFIGRALWLNMVRSRLNLGTSLTIPFIGDVDLMEMATREVELKNRERHLEQDLIMASKIKLSLQEKYEHLEARRCNEEAAQCLQRKWTPGDSKKDLAYSSLKSFINNLSTVTRATTPQEKRLRGLHKDLVQETDKVVAECKVILSKDIGPNRMTIGSGRIQSLESRLASLENLTEQVASGQKELKKTRPPELHPIMMKDSSKSVKNKAKSNSRPT